MTHEFVERCEGEFDEADWVFGRGGLPEAHNTFTNSSSPWFPRLNKCVRR
jgi:hypothetical protein